MLNQLLLRLRDVSPTPETEVIVLVVDNRPDHGVREFNESAVQRLGLPLVWVEEPSPGISQARNRAVLESLALGANAIAFLDDDNLPLPDWLKELASAAERDNADIVIGNRRKADRDNASNGLMLVDTDHLWKREGLPDLMSTANVLIRITLLKRLMVSASAFDVRFSPMGGEDADFFMRAKALGARFSVAPASIVEFRTEGARASFAGQVARKFKAGCSQAHLVRKHQNFSHSLRWITRLLIRTLAQTVLLPIKILQPSSRNETIAKLGNSLGAWYGLFGGTINYYRGSGLSE
jgi:succinoglycan biosynthesis protein ExoM